MLQELDVHSNRLTGRFPAALLDLMDLSELRLSNNSFRWRAVMPCMPTCIWVVVEVQSCCLVLLLFACCWVHTNSCVYKQFVYKGRLETQVIQEISLPESIWLPTSATPTSIYARLSFTYVVFVHCDCWSFCLSSNARKA